MDAENLIVLIVIPQNRFCDQQLSELNSVFEAASVKTVTLSKSGSEAVGEMKTKVTPDGILVDWDKRFLPNKKYDAVVVVGGKGAKSSIWNDPILPQIITDHYRAGKIVGALGISVISLVRAGLLAGHEVADTNHEKCNQELKEAGAYVVEEPLTCSNKFVTAFGESSGKLLAATVLEILGVT